MLGNKKEAFLVKESRFDFNIVWITHFVSLLLQNPNPNLNPAQFWTIAKGIYGKKKLIINDVAFPVHYAPSCCVLKFLFIPKPKV